jgi:hypothetical protein
MSSKLTELENLLKLMPITFNYHDEQRLKKAYELEGPSGYHATFQKIQNEIFSVFRSNLRINHSNY